MYDFQYDTQDATIFTLVMQARDAISQMSKKLLANLGLSKKSDPKKVFQAILKDKNPRVRLALRKMLKGHQPTNTKQPEKQPEKE